MRAWDWRQFRIRRAKYLGFRYQRVGKIEYFTDSVMSRPFFICLRRKTWYFYFFPPASSRRNPFLRWRTARDFRIRVGTASESKLNNISGFNRAVCLIGKRNGINFVLLLQSRILCSQRNGHGVTAVCIIFYVYSFDIKAIKMVVW